MNEEIKSLKGKVDDMRKLYLETHNNEVLDEWRRVTLALRDAQATIRRSKRARIED